MVGRKLFAAANGAAQFCSGVMTRRFLASKRFADWVNIGGLLSKSVSSAPFDPDLTRIEEV
jgi:hypothetical protein